jgi:hypothetical protein
MELIDWPEVARSALWILGLSIALASWSYITWWASVHRMPMRDALTLPRFRTSFLVGLTLFCAGLAWGSTRWWERGLWIVLGLACLWQVAVGRHAAAAHGRSTAPDRSPVHAADEELPSREHPQPIHEDHGR